MLGTTSLYLENQQWQIEINICTRKIRQFSQTFLDKQVGVVVVICDLF